MPNLVAATPVMASANKEDVMKNEKEGELNEESSWRKSPMWLEALLAAVEAGQR